MAFPIADFFKGGVEGLFKGARDLISLWKLDPAIAAKNEQERAAWAAKMAELEITIKQSELQAEVSLAQAQMEINKIEAASEDKFVRRARPAAMWVCVFGLAYATCIDPILAWLSINFGWKEPPVLNVEVLTTCLFALLGIGAYRSFDKLKGTSK